MIAIVRHAPFAIDRITAELDDFPAHITARHRNNLDRQRKLTEHTDHLRRIRYTDELFRGGSENFLSGQSGAAAFDQLQVRIALIGAVNIDRNLTGAVEVEDRDIV